MRHPDAHIRLLSLLCLLLLAGGGLALLAGAASAEQKAAIGLETPDQAVEAFDQIVPGMTRAEDLAAIGFDTSGDVDILSAAGIAARFRAAGRDDSVEACLRAQAWCTGYVFHTRSDARTMLGEALDFAHVTAGKHQPADIILLVMNGRVVHKVFFGDTPGRPQLMARASF